MGTGRQAYDKPRQAQREKRKEREKEREKRCRFTMFVNESAAAGCGIQNDSEEKKCDLVQRVLESLVRESFS